MKVIVMPARVCPNCHSPKAIGDRKGLDFQCPRCGFDFCVRCFKLIYEGDGSTIKCPNQSCGAILELPQSQHG